MNRAAAGRAVKDESAEFSLQIGLHVQQLKAEHLRLERDGMGAVKASVVSLVHDGACVLRLPGNRSDGAFGDVAFPMRHDAGTLVRCSGETAAT